jgi:hypothetical protein
MIEDGIRTGLPIQAREKALAVARIAGQGVPGVKVARARSAASVRNGGEPARIWLPCGAVRGMPASG